MKHLNQNLKTISRAIIMAVMSISICVSAHPNDDLSLKHIGVGTKLVITDDINIPAEVSDAIYDMKSKKDSLKRCFFSTHIRNYDRVLEKGSELVITKVLSKSEIYSHDGAVVNLEINGGLSDENSENIYRIGCFFDVTIGEFKQMLQENSVANVVLATPKKMK